jgi:hypothetical protein
MVMATVSQDVLGLVLDDLAGYRVGTSAVCRVLDEAAALGKFLAVDVGGSDVDAVDADVAVAEVGGVGGAGAAGWVSMGGCRGEEEDCDRGVLWYGRWLTCRSKPEQCC